MSVSFRNPGHMAEKVLHKYIQLTTGAAPNQMINDQNKQQEKRTLGIIWQEKGRQSDPTLSSFTGQPETIILNIKCPSAKCQDNWIVFLMNASFACKSKSVCCQGHFWDNWQQKIKIRSYQEAGRMLLIGWFLWRGKSLCLLVENGRWEEVEHFQKLRRKTIYSSIFTPFFIAWDYFNKNE